MGVDATNKDYEIKFIISLHCAISITKKVS